MMTNIPYFNELGFFFFFLFSFLTCLQVFSCLSILVMAKGLPVAEMLECHLLVESFKFPIFLKIHFQKQNYHIYYRISGLEGILEIRSLVLERGKISPYKSAANLREMYTHALTNAQVSPITTVSFTELYGKYSQS